MKHDDWLERAKARTPSMYAHVIGKQPPATAGQALAFLRCDCGMLQFTRAELHGQAVRCDNCAQNAKQGEAAALERLASAHMAPAAPLQARSPSWALALLLLALAAVWIGNRVAQAPAREDVMRSMVAS
jgi:hypothetical protein